MRIGKENSNKTSDLSIAMVGDLDIESRIPLAQEIEKAGVKVCFISPKLSNEKRSNFPLHYEYDLYVGANIVRLFGSILSLRRALKDSDAQIFHTFDTKPGLLTTLAVWPNGRKCILRTITGCGRAMAEGSNKLLKMLYISSQRIACRYTAHTVFQNPDDRDEFISRNICNTDSSSVILGSGIDESKFYKSTERKSPPEYKRVRNGELIFVCISRILASKGIVNYLNAARDILTEHPNVHFYLLGPLCPGSHDGIDIKTIENYSHEVTYLGERTDIVEILEYSHVSVLASRYREGIPRVLLEAGFMSHVIITADRPGCREVIFDGENGILIDPSDEFQLVKAIGEVIGGYNEKYAPGAVEALPKFRNLYSVPIIGKQYCSAYQKMHNGIR